jgi:muramoyltetrapeptide carboxypeptidase
MERGRELLGKGKPGPQTLSGCIGQLCSDHDHRQVIKPRGLRRGDTIGVVAAASNIKKDLLEKGCQELEELGFKTYFRPDIISSFRYFSGTRERRLGEFLEMLKSPDIHAIFCARGGYGSGQLIPSIDADVIRANAKIVSGSSDITFLLNWFERTGVVSFHGPMVATTIREGKAGYDRVLLLDMLQARKAVRFPTEETTVLRSGSAEGRLIGGCLSIVVATLGTKHEIDTRDAILVLEDIDTKPYQIDRMIMHLKQAGKLESVRGIVFGQMLNCTQHADQGYTLQEVLTDLLAEFSFPILYGFPTGHTSRPNVIVPFGVRARLDLTSSAPLFELLESAVN